MPEVNPLLPPSVVIVTGVEEDWGAGSGRLLPAGLGANWELAGKTVDRLSSCSRSYVASTPARRVWWSPNLHAASACSPFAKSLFLTCAALPLKSRSCTGSGLNRMSVYRVKVETCVERLPAVF